MSYLFIVSIGPVQEFIASARRSRDLWFGSWLLSELAKAAALTIAQLTPADGHYGLIFPHPDADLESGSKFNVANKIVALIDQSPDEVGKEVRTKVLDRLQEIRDKAFGSITSSYFFKDIAETQVEDLLELYWVATPLTNPHDEKNYIEARKYAEALLAARKTTRNFAPVSWGKPVPKSSLDGLRESVLDKSAYEQLNEKQLYDRFGVRPGEQLCGIGFLKRHGNRDNQENFYSTSHIAALPLLQTITANAQQSVQTYIETLQLLEIASEALKPPTGWCHPAFNYDGHLLFAEQLADFFDKSDKDKSDKDKKANLQEARKALATFLDTSARGQSPLPYYALLHADGDFMGKAIDAQKSASAHRNLSQQLAEFAQTVEEIVEEEHQGSLIYAGGDDVLAFLPLHKVLACARKLAETFRAQMAKFETEEKISPTLSVGIAITHHIEPLSDALQLVRDAEKKAKQVEGKNALAITLSKRSGGERTVSGRWGALDVRLEKFIEFHQREWIPDGVAYELQQLSIELAAVPEAIYPEAKRILKRKRAQRGQEKIQEGVIDQILQHLKPDDTQESSISTAHLSNLANELIIASHLAQALEQADIQPAPVPSTESQEQKP